MEEPQRPARGRKNLPLAILKGYGRLFLAVLGWGLAFSLALGAAAAVVWPLWALASGRRTAYNVLVLGIGALFLGATAVMAVRRALGSGKGPAALARKAALALALAAAWIIMALSGYLCLAFAARGLALAAAPSGLVCLSLAGYLFFGRKRG